ncbi:MAG: heme o synthase [Parvicellaceae bacterium]
MQNKVTAQSKTVSLKVKLKSYSDLTKFRLSALVVVSAILGYLIAPGEFSLSTLIYLFLGGFFVTGSSNAFNQVLERDLDKLMKRTQNRPLPLGNLSVFEGLFFAFLIGLVGVFFLWLINDSCAFLGFLALVLYVVVYTPLKTKTPFAVFVGALPGSFPPMLGYIAASGSFGLEPGILFMIQFFWQFPHFWALCWKLDDDYKLAGFVLLPSGYRDKKSAFQIMLYAAFLIPVTMLPWVVNMSGYFSMLFGVLASLCMLIPAIRLYISLDMKYAKQVMFLSFVYLPFVLLVYYLDKI